MSDAERRDRDAGAEEVLRAGDAGPRTPSAKPWSASGSAGERAPIVLRDVVAAEDERVVAGSMLLEGRAAVEADAERVGAVQLRSMITASMNTWRRG